MLNTRFSQSGWFFTFALGAVLLAFAPNVRPAGLFIDGLDARSHALGGLEVAQTGSPIAAMNSNPAALSFTSRLQAELTLGGAFLDADFEQSSGEKADLGDLAAFAPPAAVVFRPRREFPLAIGLGFLPEIMTEADWRYDDAPGGLGGATSYGERRHRSRLTSLRTSLGLGAQITRWLSLGASAGVVYNQDALLAPYVFQSQPVLSGFKTALDLEVDGVGAAFNFGAQLRPSSKVTIGLSYRPQTEIDSDGSASGNASAQLQSLGGGFAEVDPRFRYDATVHVKLPQIVSSGIEWQATERLRLLGGIDWIDWSNAFDELVIDLRDGSNPAINSVVGSNAMRDVVPLRWRDQFVYRAGLEFAATENITLRGGYTYARSAVPSETLTPLTAAIFEHKVSAGIGYRAGRYHTGLSWQWALPASQRIGESALRSGEYSQTKVRVSAHSAELSTGIDF